MRAWLFRVDLWQLLLRGLVTVCAYHEDLIITSSFWVGFGCWILLRIAMRGRGWLFRSLFEPRRWRNRLETCPIGITGRSGTLIDGVGLKCATFPWHAVPVVPPPQPPPPQPPPKFVRVLQSVDVYDMPDPPPGDTRKGELPAGTADVTLVEKGPDDWYLLSWPGNPAGADWVYSGSDYVSLDPATLGP